MSCTITRWQWVNWCYMLLEFYGHGHCLGTCQSTILFGCVQAINLMYYAQLAISAYWINTLKILACLHVHAKHKNIVAHYANNVLLWVCNSMCGLSLCYLCIWPQWANNKTSFLISLLFTKQTYIKIQQSNQYSPIPYTIYGIIAAWLLLQFHCKFHVVYLVICFQLHISDLACDNR